MIVVVVVTRGPIVAVVVTVRRELLLVQASKASVWKTSIASVTRSMIADILISAMNLERVASLIQDCFGQNMKV